MDQASGRILAFSVQVWALLGNPIPIDVMFPLTLGCLSTRHGMPQYWIRVCPNQLTNTLVVVNSPRIVLNCSSLTSIALVWHYAISNWGNLQGLMEESWSTFPFPFPIIFLLPAVLLTYRSSDPVLSLGTYQSS